KNHRDTKGSDPSVPNFGTGEGSDPLLLSESHAVDDVLEDITVSIEIVLWCDTYEVVELTIGRQSRVHPVYFTSSSGRLIGSLSQVACPAAHAVRCVTASNAHAWIRSLQIVQ